MSNTRRSIPFPIPSAFRAEMATLIPALAMSDLLALREAVAAELDRREGRQKYTIPPHIEALLN